MSPSKPKATAGLHHVAIYVEKFDECAEFYIHLLGMEIMWQPDADNLYLTSSNHSDNFALHRAPKDFQADRSQRLDHFGFFLHTPEEVDQWYAYLLAEQVTIKAAPKDHRDGTRSFYAADPDGNVFQMIYYPFTKF